MYIERRPAQAKKLATGPGELEHQNPVRWRAVPRGLCLSAIFIAAQGFDHLGSDERPEAEDLWTVIAGEPGLHSWFSRREKGSVFSE